jgi:hypothetical protein
MCAGVDRKNVLQLVEFSVQCFTDLADSMGALLQLQLGEHQVTARNTGCAKKHKQWDLRCPTLWNFVDLWSVRPGGLKGFAAAMDINKDKLGRYHRNCDQKGCTLKSLAVINVESVIVRFVLDSAQKCARPPSTNPVIVAGSKQIATRITPLHLRSISGGGLSSIHALGSAVDRPEWVMKSQRDDRVHPIRQGMRGRKLFQNLKFESEFESVSLMSTLK